MADPGKIKIERITVRDIAAFVETYLRDVAEGAVIPISRARSRAHAANPYADADDIGLLVAYVGAECVGYLGIMPGRIRVGSELKKIHYLSTWYTLPEPRAKGVGALLMMEALSLKYDIIITGTSREADALYRAMRFKEREPLNYYMVLVDALDILGAPFVLIDTLLERKGRSVRVLKRVSSLTRRFAYPAIKRLFYKCVEHSIGKVLNQVTVHDLADWPLDVQPNGHVPTESAIYYRGPEVVNWMLQHPWITEVDAEATPGYYFTHQRPLFRYHVFRVVKRESSDTIAVAVVSVSEEGGMRFLRTLDYSVSSPDGFRYLAFVILKYAATYSIDRMLIPTEAARFAPRYLIRPLLLKKTRFYFGRPRKKDSVLDPVFDSVHISYADSDCAFV